jgi:glycosyltransferase involved in cell wall biosynthesis
VKNINMVNYFAPIDSSGIPVGHHAKAIMEYIRLIKKMGGFNIRVFCPKELKPYLENIEATDLKYSFIGGKKRIYSKVLSIVKRMININSLINKSAEHDIIWFSSVDYVLYIYLLLFKLKIKKKSLNIVVTLYQIKYNSFLKNILAKISIHLVDLVVLTNNNIALPIKHLYMPDYFFDEGLYNKYRANEKKYDFICVGLMKKNKELHELVKVFNNLNLNLKIIGKFEDEQLFGELVAIANTNITIENKYLSNSEYYNLISCANFVCLPYKNDIYDNKTTGVLLETIFLNSIPIAPKKILKKNNVAGIGYEKITELESILCVSNLDYSSMQISNGKIVDNLNFTKFLTKLQGSLEFKD